MAEQGDKADRTQPASQRRLEQARDEGNVPLSRELPSFAGLGFATMLLLMAGPGLGEAFANRMGWLLANAPSLAPQDAVRNGVLAAALVVTPFALGAAGSATVAVLLQTRFLLKPSALMPDFGRLDPRRGLSRLFGVDGLVEAGKSVTKLAILGLAVWNAVSGVLPALEGAVFWDPGVLADHMLHQVLHLMLVLLGVQAVIAGADIAWVRYRHNKNLRMSRQELKHESQETDGNPHVKAKLRHLRMVRARRRMIAAIPQATVIVTNPTHYAIALVYERGKSSAPRVVAKGVDEVAARIRAAAQDHRVPLVANPPLARALYGVELDAEIPAEHFKAVAEIIAYVWRLRARGSAARRT